MRRKRFQCFGCGFGLCMVKRWDGDNGQGWQECAPFACWFSRRNVIYGKGNIGRVMRGWWVRVADTCVGGSEDILAGITIFTYGYLFCFPKYFKTLRILEHLPSVSSLPWIFLRLLYDINFKRYKTGNASNLNFNFPHTNEFTFPPPQRRHPYTITYDCAHWRPTW